MNGWLRDSASAGLSWLRGGARRQDYNLLAARIRRAAPAEPPAGLRLMWLGGIDDPRMAPAVAINSEQGLGQDWCEEQLQAGARCLLALAEDTRPVAAAWLIDREFWIDEIGHSIHPEPRGCYLYADWVTPAYRGRGLQRLMIRERIAAGAQAGKREAFSVVRPENLPSLRSYQACGFGAAVGVARIRAGRLTITCSRKLTNAPPIPRLLHTGWDIGGRVFATRNRFNG